MAHNRFQLGSGRYQCESCKRQTRATDADSASLKLCELCYTVAGIENQVADEGETPELLAEIKALQAKILEKGGKL